MSSLSPFSIPGPGSESLVRRRNRADPGGIENERLSEDPFYPRSQGPDGESLLNPKDRSTGPQSKQGEPCFNPKTFTFLRWVLINSLLTYFPFKREGRSPMTYGRRDGLNEKTRKEIRVPFYSGSTSTVVCRVGCTRRDENESTNSTPSRPGR